MEEGHWESWIRGFLAGDDAAVSEFWDQYGSLLQRVAAGHMAERLRQRVGAEDVVQSACRTFFRRAKTGQLKLDDGESLWRLLCAITLTKVREQARYHLRQKRSADREIPNTASNESGADLQFAAPGPSPDEEVAFADNFAHVLESLNEEERSIVDLKLQDYTHDEVAERLGMSERSVRRLFKVLQGKLTRAFGQDADPE